MAFVVATVLVDVSAMFLGRRSVVSVVTTVPLYKVICCVYFYEGGHTRVSEWGMREE